MEGQHMLAELAWRTWPLREAEPWSWGMLLIFPAVILLAWGVAGSLASGVAAAAVLAVCLRGYLLPVQYELSGAGIVQTALGRRNVTPWSAVRSYHLHSAGLFVARHSDPGSLPPLHAMYLPWGRHGNEVCRVFQWYLGFPPESS